MTLDFVAEASSELYEAAEYYEARQPGLGARFRSDLAEVCRLIVQNPLLWRERTGGYRRVNCPVFPYPPHWSADPPSAASQPGPKPPTDPRFTRKRNGLVADA